jgi:hypothetical protein
VQVVKDIIFHSFQREERHRGRNLKASTMKSKKEKPRQNLTLHNNPKDQVYPRANINSEAKTTCKTAKRRSKPREKTQPHTHNNTARAENLGGGGRSFLTGFQPKTMLNSP